MSKSSDAVKKWRETTKERMVSALGGKCVCCGYDKCNWALEFHHVNPDEKSFSMGGMRANPRSWSVVVVELRKCVLLCSNCHKEVEHGIRPLPKVYQTFDEKYAEYSNKETISHKYETRACPDCGGYFDAYKGRTIRCVGCREFKKISSTAKRAKIERTKKVGNKTFYAGTIVRNCSVCLERLVVEPWNRKVCFGCRPKCTRPRKVTWPEKEQLTEDVKTLSWCAIGRKYGVSDNAVRKWARAYKLV